MQKESRENFQSKFGFILACVGSAVGMGNIWLFPYRVAQFGGAAFLIPYAVCVIVLGVAGSAGEMAFGRAMESGPLGAFDKAARLRGSKIGAWIGLIPTLGSLALAIGYSVVVGWIIRYLAASVSGEVLNVETTSFFGEICGNFGSLPWHLIGLGITFILMILGVANGIEKINKIMMPLFFVLFAILAVRVAFLDGAMEGYVYLFKPVWSEVLNVQTWVYALGQAFFSLSLAGSGTLVYGSYLKKTEDVIACAKTVAIFDTMAATLAALVIIPSVFVFGMDLSSGPGLMFITMPKVFQMMPFGRLFSIVFFTAVFFAAITSLINLFESSVEALQTKFGLSRKLSVAAIALVGTVVGVMIENGDTVSNWMDVVSIYIIPLGALLAAIMFFWVCPKGFAREQVQMGREKKLGSWFEVLTKYVFVGLTIVVYILGILYGGIG
ncbi:MAG: sodium-dependent transporter [Ruminococcus sp.]|nr:sodium-dependent transporter [Ruminococcus sp.]